MKALLMLHSTGTGPAMWSGVPDEALGGRAVHAPTHLGYAPNPPAARGEPCGLNEDVAHVLAGIPESYTSIDVAAHSYGGLVAAKLLPALGGRVRSLFLYEPVLFGALHARLDEFPEAAGEVRAFAENPWFLYDEARGGTDAWLEHFVDYWNRPGSWARLPDFAKDPMRAAGWKMFQEVRSVFLVPQRFDELAVKVPITLAVGARSPAASRAMTRAVAALNPQARVVEFEKLGHMGPVTSPGAVHEALAKHLKESAL